MSENSEAFRIEKFLQRIDKDLAEKYTSKFLQLGYEEAEDLLKLDDDDFAALGIADEKERQTILLRTASLFDRHFAEKCRLRRWLREGNLVEYFGYFLAAGIASLRAAANSITDEVLEHVLHVKKPGHRKRFKCMIGELHEKRQSDLAVATGYWGKPQTMETPQHQMLCVKGHAKTPRGVDTRLVGPIELMVDTGSEFTVLTNDVVVQLNLPVCRKVPISGAHEVRETETYRGVISIGEIDVDVEVIKGSMCSVGLTVFQSFNHIIRTKSHLWLKSH